MLLAITAGFSVVVVLLISFGSLLVVPTLSVSFDLYRLPVCRCLTGIEVFDPVASGDGILFLRTRFRPCLTGTRDIVSGADFRGVAIFPAGTLAIGSAFLSLCCMRRCKWHDEEYCRAYEGDQGPVEKARLDSWHRDSRWNAYPFEKWAHGN